MVDSGKPLMMYSERINNAASKEDVGVILKEVEKDRTVDERVKMVVRAYAYAKKYDPKSEVIPETKPESTKIRIPASMQEPDNFMTPNGSALSQTDAQNDAAWKAYLASQATLSPAKQPTPCGIKFHGDTGKYSLSYYDSQAKETKFKDMENSWSGVILAVRWLAKWKYAPESKHNIRTREFESFRDEPITLLKSERGNRERDAEVVETRYSDYNAFKTALAMQVPMTDTIKYPYDLVGSIYVYSPDLENPQHGKVFRYRFSGTTRSAFFDYLKEGVSEFMTTFGVSGPFTMASKDAEGKDKTYFTGTFSRSEVPVAMRLDVIRAAREIKTWLDAAPGQKKRGGSFQDPTAPQELSGGIPVPSLMPIEAPEEEEIKVEDIPF